MPNPSPTELLRSARDQMLGWGQDSQRAREQFSWPEITGRFNWATDWFDVIARGNDACALKIREEDGTQCQWSYDEMATRSDRMAVFLRQQGVGKGDAVMLMLGNQVELWDCMLAVMKLGAVILPTAQAVTRADLTDRLKRAQVRAVVCNEVDTAKFTDLPAARDVVLLCTHDQVPDGWTALGQAYAVEPERFQAVTDVDDPCIEYFTSGTTKEPKLVEHTQLTYPVGHLSTMYFIGVRPGDVHLNISSPGWGKHAWSSFFSPWLAGATIFVYNYRRFHAADLLRQLDDAEVATFCAPPTVWRMMIQADLGERPRALREIVGAGEPLNPEVISQVQRRWGLTIRDGYGQTETTAQVGNCPGDQVKPGSMGRPLPGVPVEIIDPETGRPADDGEICLRMGEGRTGRPFHLMSRYVGAPETEAAAIHDGYYHTGDLVSRDAEGNITYVGRTDDVFKASDYKVSPFELESVLLEHPAVADAAVIPSPDPTRLAVPKAFVQLAPGWEQTQETALQILQHAKENLAPYLRVRLIEFDELPRTLSGKVRRVALRAREQVQKEHGHPTETPEYRYDQFDELKQPRQG